MIAWLLAFLALVGLGWVPPLDGGALGRSGWYVPTTGPWDHAGEQPASAPTALQRDVVAVPFLEHDGALHYQLLNPLSWHRPAARCPPVPGAVAHAKRNAQARVREEVARLPPFAPLAASVRAAPSMLQHGAGGLLTGRLACVAPPRRWDQRPAALQHAAAGGSGCFTKL